MGVGLEVMVGREVFDFSFAALGWWVHGRVLGFAVAQTAGAKDWYEGDSMCSDDGVGCLYGSCFRVA